MVRLTGIRADNGSLIIDTGKELLVEGDLIAVKVPGGTHTFRVSDKDTLTEFLRCSSSSNEYELDGCTLSHEVNGHIGVSNGKLLISVNRISLLMEFIE